MALYQWVPDGVYDYVANKTRYVISNGNPQTVISKLWLDTGGPNDVSADLRLPWGTYPDFPPKPPKN
jgi:hypothetical protein